VSASELGLSLAAGSLTTLSPCVFPLLPLVLGGALQGHRAAPLAMGAGMTASFAVAGVAVGLLGDSLGLDPARLRVFAALMLLAFGLVMVVPQFKALFTRFISPLADSANRASAHVDGGSLRGALALGALLGLIWSPCSGPLLGSALTLVASEGGAGRGALILGLFGLGAAIPLMLAAYASRGAMARVRGWVIRHGDAAQRVFGMLMLALGAAILTGADKWAEAAITAHLPDAWVSLTTGF
jgi:cytochrome c biogenesis protein CcdA